MEKAPDAPGVPDLRAAQAARKAGPVIRIAVAKEASVIMRRLLAEATSLEKPDSQIESGRNDNSRHGDASRRAGLR